MMELPPEMQAEHDRLRAHEIALAVRSDLARQAYLATGNRHERRKQAALERRKTR